MLRLICSNRLADNSKSLNATYFHKPAQPIRKERNILVMLHKFKHRYM